MASVRAKYKVALIGLGRIASSITDEVQGVPGILLPYGHMDCYRSIPEVEVVAGSDPFPEQREAFQTRWGVERTYADYQEMLEKERPDIVSITTGPRPRAKIAIDCARAGVRGIYAEKPMAHSLADADAMIEECRARGTKIAVGTQLRWDPWMRRIRELIEGGQIGRVLQVNGHGQAGIHRDGSHMIDILLYFTGGKVTWVFGEVEEEKVHTDLDMMGNGYIAIDNGARIFVRMMPSGPASWQYEIIGERGQIIHQKNGRVIEFWQVPEGGTNREVVQRLFPTPQRLDAAGGNLIRDLMRCIETGDDPAASGVDGRASLEAALAMRESHRQGGRRIDLPLADRSLYMNTAETQRDDKPAQRRPPIASRA